MLVFLISLMMIFHSDTMDQSTIIKVELSDDTIKKLIDGITQAIFEKKSMPEPYVDIDTLCDLIDSSVSKIYKLTRESNRNGFPCHRKGTSISFRVSEVEEWFNKNDKRRIRKK
jgi:predicted DNA-binding transcriptional regulator AlpA